MSFEAHYKNIEIEFKNLFSQVKGVLTSAEFEGVQEYIDACEYGLALDNFIGIIVEENKLISQASFEQVLKIASLMSMDQKSIGNDLSPFIK